MRRREGDVALRTALGELGLVQPVDGAAGDEFNVGAGLLLEFLGDRLFDRSFQLPPQTETTSFSAASDVVDDKASPIAVRIASFVFMITTPV